VSHEGRIAAGGIERDVAFEDIGQVIDDQLDAASLTKYHSDAASIVDRIGSPEARSATLKLVPRPLGVTQAGRRPRA
jgi:hypothetical protein